MYCSVIIALICYACTYNAGMLCTEGSMGISRYCNSASSVLLLLHISKDHLVQGLSTRVANHSCAWTHTYKNGSYHYFTCLYSVVISNSISVSEYWHKYPALELSSISRSSALILAHITKKNFNSAYCPGSQYCYRYLGLTTNVHVQEM